MAEKKIGALACAEEIRQRYSLPILEHLQNCGEEVLQVGSNKWAIPCLDMNGDDATCVIVVQVPKGAKGEGYDPYAESEAYAVDAKAKAEAKAARQAAKEKKAAADKAKREAAKAKAE